MFRSYENKKLVVGRMPESYFIRIEKGGGEEKEEKRDDGPKPPVCTEPGSSYSCFTDIATGEYICGCFFG
ncbi:MAG: hypothetical protein IJI41_00795 [Anaerolineaceae bacterium]|nr:hypothetical protein [Anaerolineaceae bacterium]